MLGITAWLARSLWTHSRTPINGQKAQTTLPCNVISIGNISMGGTGKTPLARWTAAHYEGLGTHTGIVATGYMGGDESDEVREHKRSCPRVPIAASRSREIAARCLLNDHNMQLIILDDGFQYQRLHRDLDILVLDATIPLHFLHPLLREPLAGIGRADIICLSKVDGTPTSELQAMRSQIGTWARRDVVLAEFVYEPSIPHTLTENKPTFLSDLEGTPVVAMSAIGNPSYFARVIEKSGARVVRQLCFPDHHRYSRADLLWTEQEVHACHANSLVVTEKDAVKLKGWKPPFDVWKLGINIKFTLGEAALTNQLKLLIDLEDKRR